MLQLGHELLLTRELEGSAEVKGDVLLSMALACCNMAAEALELENQVGRGKGGPPVNRCSFV